MGGPRGTVPEDVMAEKAAGLNQALVSQYSLVTLGDNGMSHVTCHLLHVTCQVSHVTRHQGLPHNFFKDV